MTMKAKAIFILLLSTFIIFGSCTKSKEAKLEGKWEQIDIMNYSVPAALKTRTIWEFKSGELIVYEIAPGTTALVEKTREKYTLGFNGVDYTLNLTQLVSGKDLYWKQGDGKIKQLNDSYLKWFNKNGFYGEFVRYE